MYDAIKSVSKHSIIYGFGDLVSKGIGFLLIPLYTHYLQPAEYGILELLDLTTYIIGLLVAMGISQSVVRYYFEYEDKKRKDQVISIAILTSGGISLVALPMLIIFAPDISNIVLESSEYAHYFVVIFISMIIDIFNGIPRALMRIKQQSKLFVSISICRLFVALSLNILFIVHYQMGVMGILLSGLISASLSGLFLAGYVFRQVKLSWSFDIFNVMIRYSFPLVWTWFGAFILHFGDRFLLQKLDSLESVGIYSLAYKFGMMANVLVVSPFMMTWAPKQFEIVKKPDAKKTYSYIFTYFVLALVYVSLGIAILIKDVVVIVSDQQYHSAYTYVPTILAAYVFYGIYSYVQFGILLRKKTKYMGLCFLAISIVNITLNFILIPILSIWGAALVTGISHLLLTVTIYSIAQRLYHIPYQFGRLIKIAIMALTLFYITSLIDLKPTLLSIGVKFIIALSYPLLLRLMRFYTVDELAKLAEIRQQLYGQIKTWLGFGEK